MRRLVIVLGLCALPLAARPSVGPDRGALVICGGGRLGPEIIEEFIALAGGPEAPIVYIPTASDANQFPPGYVQKSALFRGGAKNLTLLHTRDRKQADSEAFVAPLRTARGIWFEGGRQWRLVDSYLNTRAEREMLALLQRGGVIGGSSAGATIQGSYLVRGAREGNTVMMAKGYEQGLGFVRGVAIDQHLLARHRENDMLQVIAAHPDLLGIGLDEGTAIVVRGDTAKVIGASKVAIYDRQHKPGAGGTAYYFLTPGDEFDLSKRQAKRYAPGAFMNEVETTLLATGVESSRASWIKNTYITADTELLAAKASERDIKATVDFVKKSAQFAKQTLPADLARKMKLLKFSLTIATPSDPKEAEELTRITASMEGTYGKGKYCPQGGALPKDKCLDLEDLSKIMATSRNPDELREAWTGWHAIAKPLRKDFMRYVELANKGARELGFADNGAMWRSKYDMPPEAFARELDRLWEQVKPLYQSLHAYIRARLREKYGELVPAAGPIPAHLLGNMWAQEWENIYPLAAPANADPGYDLTEILKRRDTDYKQMVRYGEHFFTSLGFAPLPTTFWERSMFIKPRDREVVCHASAWDVDAVNDLRLKMCIDITAEDFNTIHHELGHNFYQRAYNRQPFLFRDSANDGFHEALGDTIALSVTPEYLVKIKLLDRAPDPSKDIGLLMNRALEKIAFLPFGLVIDQWRWKVFQGEIKPERYNQAWWELRQKYQGIAPPLPRSEADFDPGAKFHVSANVPYARYFLADILQFQFHRALARIAGCTGPLHRCSIYGNQEAGKRLAAMMEMGQSRPWPEALYALTGQREMDATAIRDYFAPLQKWLDEQNAGKPTGW
jgi:peptidyl-dipeptidase A